MTRSHFHFYITTNGNEAFGRGGEGEVIGLKKVGGVVFAHHFYLFFISSSVKCSVEVL